MSASRNRQRVEQTLAELGMGEAVRARKLRLFAEARRLTPVGLGTDGRDKLLAPAAAAAWLKMRDAAARAGVELLMVSGFRSFDFQLALIRAKLQRGMSVEAVLQVNAPPGYSEHHTGRAVDVGTSGCAPLEEEFEKTAAFRWLRKNARRYRYTLSYPRGNREGFLYEPWHWCYH